MLTFTLAISCLTTSNLPWFMDLTFQIPMQYCCLKYQTSLSITSHIHNWVLFLLWFHPFILSGVIFPLISISILGTYQHGEFLSQYPIILPFHTDLPLEEPICRSGSNSKNWTWNKRLILSGKRSTSRLTLYIVRVHFEKHRTGRSISWNQDCREKYQ